MTDKQKIKKEIERLKTQNETYPDKEYAESTKWYKHGAYDICFKLLNFIDSLPEEHINFPHERNIVDKVFGAGNLESWEYEEAEKLVLFAKEELLKDLEKDKEPASEDLEEYAKKLAKGAALDEHNLIWMCKKGAEWQKKQMRETLQKGSQAII